MTRPKITRSTARALLFAIYKREGWELVDKPSVSRCEKLYRITADYRNDRYTAHRREPLPCPSIPETTSSS